MHFYADNGMPLLTGRVWPGLLQRLFRPLITWIPSRNIWTGCVPLPITDNFAAWSGSRTGRGTGRHGGAGRHGHVVARFNRFPPSAANGGEYGGQSAALDLALTPDEVRWLETGARD